jgi:hypothetical protein
VRDFEKRSLASVKPTKGNFAGLRANRNHHFAEMIFSPEISRKLRQVFLPVLAGVVFWLVAAAPAEAAGRGFFSLRPLWSDFVKTSTSSAGGAGESGDERVSVTNNVSVSVSTGGNSSVGGDDGLDGGVISTGAGRAAVDVKTTVKGVVVEDFSEDFFGGTTTKREWRDAGGTTWTKVEVEVDGPGASNQAVGWQSEPSRATTTEFSPRPREKILERRRESAIERAMTTVESSARTNRLASSTAADVQKRTRDYWLKDFFKRIFALLPF